MLAPSTLTMKTGSKLWISSDEMSISMLTKPRTQILAGSRPRCVVAGMWGASCVWNQATVTAAPVAAAPMVPIRYTVSQAAQVVAAVASALAASTTTTMPMPLLKVRFIS